MEYVNCLILLNLKIIKMLGSLNIFNHLLLNVHVLSISPVNQPAQVTRWFLAYDSSEI